MSQRHNVSFNDTQWQTLREEAHARQRTTSNYIHAIIARRSMLMPDADMQIPTESERSTRLSDEPMPGKNMQVPGKNTPVQLYSNGGWLCTKCNVTFPKYMDACELCGAGVPIAN